MIKTRVKANSLPLAIGSFPNKDASAALDMIFKYFNKIPLWPQLPQRSFKEEMYLQYSKLLPGLVINNLNKSFYVQYDDDIYEKIADYFEGTMVEDLSAFAIDEDFAEGLTEFLKQKDRIKIMEPLAVKGHITGPVSLALGLHDQNKKPVIYHQEYMEVIVQQVIKKSQWQIKKLKEINRNVIYFLDEPYLSSMGSGMLNLKPEELKKYITDVVDIIKEEDVLLGVHCCGSTDWSFIMDLGFDIISFDAYNFGEDLLQHTEQLKHFMHNGGILAWGIVPSNKEVEGTNLDYMTGRMYKYLTVLSDAGFNVKDVLKHSFITPSCGMGSATELLTEKIIQYTLQISSRLKKEYSI
ncbi:MAG: hypothetical protein ABIH00_02260 [Armatimonadota bacterium]